VTHVLVVANETVAGRALTDTLERLERRGREGEVRSGWLRKDVVRRLAVATRLPVEHVEVKREAVGAPS
jgi:hypothetical protein